MQEELISTLQGLRSDPSLVVVLYEQLAKADFLAMVRVGTERSIKSMEFLTYPSSGDVRELPLFTQPEFVLELQVDDLALAELRGPTLWPRLLDIVKTGECEIAVDPGQAHGIRLTREMVLGMVGAYLDA